MGRRPLLAMALGWVLVVAAVAAVTFMVVVRAGRGVGQASAARTVAALPSEATSRPPSPTPPTTTPAGSSTPTPAATRTTPPAPTRSARPPAPAPTPTVRQAETRTVSFTTEAGTVVASCAGSVLTLESITPRDGWRFEDDAEDDGLEVKFKTRLDDVDDVEITIGCVRGTPTRLED